MNHDRNDRIGEIMSYVANMAIGFGIGKFTNNASEMPFDMHVDCRPGVYKRNGILHVIADIDLPKSPLGTEVRQGKLVIIINPSVNRGNLVPWCSNINILEMSGVCAPFDIHTIPMQNIYKALDQLCDWHMPVTF